MEYLKTILYGIIEGITEWLPISSTGHLILAEKLLDLPYSDEFMSMFRVVIQLGAILAVVLLYFPKLWPFAQTRPKVRKKTPGPSGLKFWWRPSRRWYWGFCSMTGWTPICTTTSPWRLC